MDDAVPLNWYKKNEKTCAWPLNMYPIKRFIEKRLIEKNLL